MLHLHDGTGGVGNINDDIPQHDELVVDHFEFGAAFWAGEDVSGFGFCKVDACSTFTAFCHNITRIFITINYINT